MIFGHNSNNTNSSYNDIDLASITFTSSGIGFKVAYFFIKNTYLMIDFMNNRISLFYGLVSE